MILHASHSQSLCSDVANQFSDSEAGSLHEATSNTNQFQLVSDLT